MDKNNFAVFILTHKRANKVVTTDTLKRCGYTGKIIYIIDNQDPTEEEYFAKFGKENVYVFDKLKAAEMTDTMDNEQHQRGVVFARNIVWTVAEELNIDYFIVLDDDYSEFRHLTNPKGKAQHKSISNLDKIFAAMTEFLIVSNALTVCMGQGGDYIGGVGYEKPKRKAMNSFVCAKDRPFKFLGRINEDVNMYVSLGHQGKLMFSIMKIALNQIMTQTNSGGLTELYLDSGTYVKSFFSVVCHPSGVKVAMLRGQQHSRLHHRVSWDRTAPCIISETYKKAVINNATS
jgi:hypothetical protein